MKSFVAIAAVATLSCTVAHSQVFKCVVNGAVTYQPTECEQKDVIAKKVDVSGAGKEDFSSAGAVSAISDVAKVARMEKVRDAIADQKVFIGMTSQEARSSWGAATTINKTILKNSIKEQWVYRSGSSTQYLYFTNGTLDTIQGN